MNDFLTIVTALKKDKKQVLATIVNVEGSSYRKKGSMFVCDEDGVHVGLLSGGCLEADIKERCKEVISLNRSCTVEYDLSSIDDLNWGQGTGCNGRITVFLELLTEKLKHHMEKVANYLIKGIPIIHVKQLSSTENYLFSTEKGENFGCWVEDGNSPDYRQILFPQPRLVIFGAGADVQPLISFARKIGFYVVCTDWRTSLCEKITDADEMVKSLPRDFFAHYPFSIQDYVVVMTHHFQRDKEIVRELLSRKIAYLGVLGPKERTLRLLDDKFDIQSIHSPVGLCIDADGPEEIAISIIAELIKTVREREKNGYWDLFGSWGK